jgi:hypothetical protein
MNITMLEIELQERGFKSHDLDNNKVYDSVDLLHDTFMVMCDYGPYKVMVSYCSDSNNYEITDFYCTDNEMGDRAFNTDDEEEVLAICVYLVEEARIRTQLESAFNLVSV